MHEASSQPSKSFPLVAIVLINWNSLADTCECIESLNRVAYAPLHIVVVDNGSRDDQSIDIQHRFPGVQVHAAGRNLGYTGGNNLGLRLAMDRGADYILYLNNDTTAASDFLLRMVDAMEAHPQAGLASAAIYEAHQPEVVTGLGCKLRFDRMLCGEPIRSLPAQAGNQPFKAPYVEGCALMLRRKTAEQTGGFDDRFFAYFEDADLCLRAKALGWFSLVVPTARVWHKVEGKPSGASSPTACFYSARNSWLLVRRHADLDERRAFFRHYPWHLCSLLKSLLRPRCLRDAPTEVQSTRSKNEALLLGTIAGFLGMTGNRATRRWAVLEVALRVSIISCLRLGSHLLSVMLRRG